MAAGVVVGTLISLAAARALKSMLLVISPRDGVTFVLVPAMLVLVAVVACWIPAMRVTRIDPTTALREE